MKFFLSMLFLTALVTHCNNQLMDADISANKIIFVTDRESYHAGDTVNVTLTNNSDSILIIGLRCGVMLEMFYQVQENNTWSGNMFFDYMTLRCLTLPDTIRSKEDFFQPLPASAFKSSGTFRLVLNKDIISNTFIIN